MARGYTVTSGLTSIAASVTKVACQLATGTTINNILRGFDISFDSVASGAGAIPVRVQIVKATGASAAGATATPGKNYPADIAAATTARVNDTTDGASPTILKEWLVSPTSGFSFQFPLGREICMNNSDFLELRLVSQAGMTTCNYVANLDFEE